MAQTYFPFDSGQGANVTELQWSKMAEHWTGSGVAPGKLEQLKVIADSSGMQVKVSSGAAWIKGHYFESDAEEILGIGTADSTNPRIDRVIVRLDWIAKTIQLAVLQGIPAVSPVPPALTQNSSRWEITLAQVTVDAGAVTIASNKVQLERTFTNLDNRVWIDLNRSNSQAISANTMTKVQFNENPKGRDSVQWDTVNHRFIVPRWGLYSFNVNVMYDSLQQYSAAELYIYKNGTQLQMLDKSVAPGITSLNNSGNITLELDDTDYIEFYVFVSQATNADHRTFATITQIA